MRVGINGLFLSRPDTGSGQYVSHLLRALSALDGGDEHLVLRPEGSSGGLRGDLAKLWFEQAAFPRAAYSLEVDALHVPYFGPPLWRPRPVVVTVHDLIPMMLPEYRGSFLVRAYTRLAAAAARRADLILADSEASRRDALRLLGVAPERARTVYLAADPSFRPPGRAAVEALRRARGLDEPYVLYLGGFDRRKNVAGIIRAFARLPAASRSRTLLAIAGRLPQAESDLFPDPRAAAREAGIEERVRYLGWVSEGEKPALYGGAACFAFPSLYEGFGLPPLEAMACGAPVVTSSAGSLPEIVGDGGMLVAPGDEEALARALLLLLEDRQERRRLSEAAVSAAARFTWERTARETLDAYREAVSWRRS